MDFKGGDGYDNKTIYYYGEINDELISKKHAGIQRIAKTGNGPAGVPRLDGFHHELEDVPQEQTPQLSQWVQS